MTSAAGPPALLEMAVGAATGGGEPAERYAAVATDLGSLAVLGAAGVVDRAGAGPGTLALADGHDLRLLVLARFEDATAVRYWLVDGWQAIAKHGAGGALSGTVLRGAVLRGARLRGVDLRDADLTGADLEKADLSHACLAGAVLAGANLFSATLQQADLTEADLSRADLRHADLRSARLARTAFRGADFWGAYLWDVDLSDCFLDGADPARADQLNITIER